MALITSFEHKPMERNSIHIPIRASYSIFEQDGQRFIQIDSYGRESRKNPGTASQKLQLDEKSAQALFDILKETFHFR